MPSAVKQTQAPAKPAVVTASNRVAASILAKTPLSSQALVEVMRSAQTYKKLDTYSSGFDLSALSGLPFEINTDVDATNQDAIPALIAYDPALEEMTVTIYSSQTGGGGNRAIGIYRRTYDTGAFEGSNAYGIRRQVKTETTVDYGLAETIRYEIGTGPGSTYIWSIRLSPAQARLVSHNLRLIITGHIQHYDQTTPLRCSDFSTTATISDPTEATTKTCTLFVKFDQFELAGVPDNASIKRIK
jgi:hypothetical protein